MSIKNQPVFMTTIVLMTVMIILSACTSISPSEEPPNIEFEPTRTDLIENVDNNEEQVPDEPAVETTSEPNIISSADRQLITFQTSDGRSIEGYFYPPKQTDAPIVVLMHWSPGTLEDWNQIAVWLQNRGDETSLFTDGLTAMIGYSIGENDPWQDPSWFPVLPSDFSVGVLSFNFGGRGNSVAGNGGEGLVMDALAAVTAASTLEGINPNQIITMGASIGAHASLNSCQLLNESESLNATCVGVFSLSPGDALTINYNDSANLLRAANPDVLIYCFAAASDGSSLPNCLSASGLNFVATAYEGGAHGMRLLNPSYTPNPLFVLLQFFETAYGWKLID